MNKTGLARTLAAIAAAASVFALAACGAGGSTSTGADQPIAGTVTVTSADTPLTEADLLPDPKAYTGTVVAQVADVSIDPVAQNPAQTLPATVTDSQGTEVTITDTSRILALDLYGSLSRIVFDLGLGDNVVGRDTSSTFVEIADLPNVTSSGHNVSGEAILALSPTVILTDTSLGPWDVFLQMRDANIPVVVVDSARSLDTTGDLIQSVADALGVPDEGAQLAQRSQEQISAKQAEIQAIAPAAVQDQLRTVFLYVRGQAGIYYLFGEGSGADGLIDALGAYDVAKEIDWQGMKPLTAEGLVDAQPDLVVMMTKGLESVDGIDGLLEAVPALAQTPAGINKRIVAMDDSDILSFGPQSSDVLDALARAIYAPPAQ